MFSVSLGDVLNLLSAASSWVRKRRGKLPSVKIDRLSYIGAYNALLLEITAKAGFADSGLVRAFVQNKEIAEASVQPLRNCTLTTLNEFQLKLECDVPIPSKTEKKFFFALRPVNTDAFDLKLKFRGCVFNDVVRVPSEMIRCAIDEHIAAKERFLNMEIDVSALGKR